MFGSCFKTLAVNLVSDVFPSFVSLNLKKSYKMTISTDKVENDSYYQHINQKMTVTTNK